MSQGRKRSGCPINLSMEVLGDSWSLIVLRDIMFGDRRHFWTSYGPNILENRCPVWGDNPFGRE